MPLFGPSGGGVSSVGLSSAGVLHSVSGSPVTAASGGGTGAGTLSLGLLTQSANAVLAGPTTGAAATPTMRALVGADIPAHDAALLTTGTLADARLSANVPLLSSGTLTCNLKANPFINDPTSTGPYFQFGASTLTLNTRGKVGLTIQGAIAQTLDLLLCQDSANHTQFAIANTGTGGSPVWGLRVRATANPESAAQLHTLGAYSGRSIQLIDDAGATLGYLPIYA